jgi:hypothetical protein
MRCLGIVAAALSACTSVLAQSSEQFFQRIEHKLASDRAYSRLSCISLQPGDLKAGSALARALGEAGAQTGEDASNGRLVLHVLCEESAAGTTVLPVMVVEVRPSQGQVQLDLYRRTLGSALYDTVVAVPFRAFFTLMRQDRQLYDSVCSFVLRNQDRMEKDLAIHRSIRQRHGSVSPDNTDYTAYAQINGSHTFLASPAAKARAGRTREWSGEGALAESEADRPGRDAQAGGQSRTSLPDSQDSEAVQGAGQREVYIPLMAPEPGTAPYTLDISFSRISFSHSILTSPQVLGIPGFGVELGFGDRVLSLLGYQSPYLGVGIWGVVGLSAEDAGVRDFFEFKALWRAPLNTPAMIDRLGLGRQKPFFALSETRINVTSGMALELNLKRFTPQLPYINIYYSFGDRNFDSPYATRMDHGVEEGYWSSNQWETSLSYYFNTDAAAINKFRLDLGAGSYNITRVGYDSFRRASREENVHPMSWVQALLALDYTYSTRGQETLFGFKLRFFDNRITVLPWMKILRTGSHELRIENTSITAPLGRAREPWEAGSADLLQFRYRYGL